MLEKVDFLRDGMKKKEYKEEHDLLMERLVLLQQQARLSKIGLVVLFEGWGGAGKGSRISDIMCELDARATSVHVTKDFDGKAFKEFVGRKWGVTGYYPVMQEFWQALGERGTITIYDRGWYTAAIEQALISEYGPISKGNLDDIMEKLEDKSALNGAPHARLAMSRNILGSYQGYARDFERTLVDDGYVVVKFFVHVRQDVRKERLEKLYNDPATRWRVSKAKLAGVKNHQQAYKLYDRLLEASNFDFAPWTLVNGEDWRRANVEIARTLIEALQTALAKRPNVQVQAAKEKALANSAGVMVAHNMPSTDMPLVTETTDVVANAENDASHDHAHKVSAESDEFEKLAQAQHVKAPRRSHYLIMSGYPQLNGTVIDPEMSKKTYHKQLKHEQKRLFRLENEMYRKRIPLMIMYEGWDAAGKGGNIKRVAQALDARAYTVFPSPAPTAPELAHPHLWRYWTRLPKAGHVGIYDRSWYGRVLVERVEGFASDDEWYRAYDEINNFEFEMVQWGAILLKFWVDVSTEEQLRRFEAREATPAKRWKITEEDWRNREKRPAYLAAINDMFRLTSTTFAPWVVLESDNKKYARIKALKIINQALEERLRKD